MRPKFFHSKLKFHTPTRTQKKLNASSRFIASEIEVASIKTNKILVESIVRKWNGSIVYDGTLPKPNGFEINTAPAAGDLYIKQITDICDALSKAGATSNNTCGLHVHLDARDYNFCDLRRLIKVYAVIEPTLFLMVPPHRRNCLYSIKCGDKLESAIINKLSHIQLKEKIVTAVYGSPDSISYRMDKRGAGHGTGRYYALNLHSWFFRGTIECRLFDGTLDKNEIIDWGVLWANVLDFALHSSDDDISAAMKKEKSYDSLIHIVKDNNELRAFIDARYDMYKDKKSAAKKEILDPFWQL